MVIITWFLKTKLEGYYFKLLLFLLWLTHVPKYRLLKFHSNLPRKKKPRRLWKALNENCDWPALEGILPVRHAGDRRWGASHDERWPCDERINNAGSSHFLRYTRQNVLSASDVCWLKWSGQPSHSWIFRQATTRHENCTPPPLLQELVSAGPRNQCCRSARRRRPSRPPSERAPKQTPPL